MPTDSFVVESYYNVDFACWPLFCFSMPAKSCYVLSDELRSPLIVHSILEVGVIDAGWCFLEPKHFAALFQLLLSFATQTLSISVRETEQV